MNSSSRRHFLKLTGGASTLLTSALMGNTGFTGWTGNESPVNDEKTLVYILFAGGLDSFNLLVPTGSAYSTYQNSRSDLALPLNSLRSLNNINYGLHQNCSGLANLFNTNKLSFLSNVGTLVEPTVKADLNPNSGHPLPLAIASHFDQQRQWESAQPRGGATASAVQGWAGRLADIINAPNSPFGNASGASMNFSLAGNNLFQVGQNNSAFVHQPGGALGLTTQGGSPTEDKNELHQAILSQSYQHHFRENFARISNNSIAQQTLIEDALSDFNENNFVGNFSGSIGNQLKDAVKLIAGRQILGLKRQTIFIKVGGWDMHGDLLDPFSRLISQVSQSIDAFQRTLEEINLASTVVSFTASDFARTLRSNGRGSDHAWGGPQFAFGEPVDGGKLFGNFPNLAINGPDDAGGGGRIIPTIAIDEYYADLLRWFGITDQDQLCEILPNLQNFNGRTPPNFIT